MNELILLLSGIEASLGVLQVALHSPGTTPQFDDFVRGTGLGIIIGVASVCAVLSLRRWRMEG